MADAKSNQFEADMLNHIFRNAAITLVGDASGLQPSTADGDLYISLHTADPTDNCDQQGPVGGPSNEATYTGYARVAVPRNATNWKAATSGDPTTENLLTIVFGACTVGVETITHFVIGTDTSGTGKALYHAALSASLAVSPGITPQFAIGDLDVTEL